ncbi:MAG: chemotaxis protein CheW [Gammaproteobacteria bacterium]
MKRTLAHREKIRVAIIDDKVRSLWIPLRDMNLLLPNVAVAEIGSYRVPEEQADTPAWFLGKVRWRGEDIPVLSLEVLYGLTVSLNPVFSRLMILNSVRSGSPVSHYAIVTAGLPGLIQFGSDTLDDYELYEKDGLKCIVRIGNEQAVIPDLDYLQAMLEQYIEIAA